MIRIQEFTRLIDEFAVLIGPVGTQAVKLHNCKSLVPGLGMERDANEVRHYSDLLSSDLFNVLVLGEFSVGKSTLINALLGNEVLPARCNPTTALITRVVFGDPFSVFVYRRNDDSPTEISREQFERDFSLNTGDCDENNAKALERFSDVDHLQIRMPHSLLQSGVSFVDTPGFGEELMRTQIAVGFLRQAHAVVFMLNALKPLAESERLMLRLIGKQRINHVFFVINRGNQVDSDEADGRVETQAWIRRGIAKYFTDERGCLDEALYHRHVFWVDALGALQARISRPVDEDELQKSGLPPFEKAFFDFLARENREQVVVEAIADNLLRIAAAARRRLRQQHNALDLPLAAIEQKRLAAETRLSRLKAESDVLRMLLNEIGQKLQFSVYADLLRYVEDLQQTWKQDAKEMIDLERASVAKLLLSEKGREAFHQHLTSEVRNYLEIKLVRWSERVSSRIQPEIAGMFRQFKAKAREFELNLASVQELFAGSESEHPVRSVIVSDWVASRIPQKEGGESALESGFGVIDFERLSVAATVSIMAKVTASGGILAALQLVIRSFWQQRSLGDSETQAITRRANGEPPGTYPDEIYRRAKNRLFDRLRIDLFEALRNQITECRTELLGGIGTEVAELSRRLISTVDASIRQVESDLARIIEYKRQRSEKQKEEHARLQSVEHEFLRSLDAACTIAYGKSPTEAEMEEASQVSALYDHGEEAPAASVSEAEAPSSEDSVAEVARSETAPANSENTQEVAKALASRFGRILTGRDPQAESDRELIRIAPELAGLIGLKSVKTQIVEWYYFVREEKRRVGINSSASPSLHMVFTGNPGTGKTTVARIIGRILKMLGFLKSGHLIEATRGDLVAEYVGQTIPKTRALIDRALDGVLFIDEAYALACSDSRVDYGSEAVSELVKRMEDDRCRLAVILAGYPDEMQNLLDINPGFRGRFSPQHIIDFPDYTPPELMEILRLKLKEGRLPLSESAEARLQQVVEGLYARRGRTFGNAREMRNLAQALGSKRAVRVGRQCLAADTAVEAEDIPLKYEAFSFTVAKEPASVVHELDSLVGLLPVKEFIRHLTARLEHDRRYGRKQSQQRLNLVFRGNPGTGKTSVARAMGKMLAALGYLRSGHVIEVTRADLVGEYRGHTEQKTRTVIERALDGVLFIDEAYQLVGGDGREDYGRIAIDVMVAALDNYKDRLVTIVAGYPNAMDIFLDANEGLASRFPHRIDFPDLSLPEMLQIMRHSAGERGYTVGVEAEVQIEASLAALRSGRPDTFGNAREVETLFDKILNKQNYRIMLLPPDTADREDKAWVIEASDVPEPDPPNARCAVRQPVSPPSGEIPLNHRASAGIAPTTNWEELVRLPPPAATRSR